MDNPAKMRLFIGIKVSGNLHRTVLQWQKEHDFLNARFTPPENLHITLLPPWYEDNPQPVIAKLDGMKASAFTITFSAIGFNSNHTLIWAEPMQPPPEILILRDALMKEFGRNSNTRFRPHMTLARFRKSASSQKTSFPPVHWEEWADYITLFESILHPEGSRYRVIHAVSLR